MHIFLNVAFTLHQVEELWIIKPTQTDLLGVLQKANRADQSAAELCFGQH